MANKLTLNIKKTNFMILSRRKDALDKSINIKINDQNIDKVHSFRFLGVTINEKLKWADHIRNISKELNKLNGIIYIWSGTC